MPRQKLGQHFLHSPAWRERIVRTLPADANTTWLEIGPGHGEMTEFLAQHSSRVIAIETDAVLAATLRQRAAREWPNVEIIEADILSVDLATLPPNQEPNPSHNQSSNHVNDPRTDSLPSANLPRISGGRGFSRDVPRASSSGVSTPEDLRQGTVSTVPNTAAPTAPLGAEASPDVSRPHQHFETGFVGRGLPAQAGFSRDKTAHPHSGALVPEVGPETREPARFGKGTVSTMPNAAAPTAPLGAEVGRSLQASESKSKDRFRVYGNLPYYITSPILSHLFRYAAQIDSIHIVIQWEVAARIAATPGHRQYAYLSALCQYFAHPEIVLRIPPGAFRPPPKVNSALVAMTLPGERIHLGIRDDAIFLKFLQTCFSQKRKTLRNNLKNVFSDSQIAASLAACTLTPKSRAEEISLPQFAELYRALASEK